MRAALLSTPALLIAGCIVWISPQCMGRTWGPEAEQREINLRGLSELSVAAKVMVTMKKMIRRKATSAIEAVGISALTAVCRSFMSRPPRNRSYSGPSTRESSRWFPLVELKPQDDR